MFDYNPKSWLETFSKLSDGIPRTMRAYNKLQQSATAPDGMLDVKLKKLITLGIAITLRADHSILIHTREAVEAGATIPEIMDTISMAILMGGEPALIAGVEAYRIASEMTAEKNNE